MSYQMVAMLKIRDLAAVKQVNANPDIEIIDMSAEARAKFRNIAKEEWAVWAEKNAITQKYYDSVVTYLQDHNLM